MMQESKKTIIASTISLFMLSACGDEVLVKEPNPNDNGEGVVSTSERRLKQLESNDAFYSALREGLVRQSQGHFVDFMTDGDILETALSNEAGSADSDAVATPTAPISNASQESSDSSSKEVTTTNVQEVGVDEQDRMKSDGDFLYILDNQYTYSWQGNEGQGEIGIDPIVPSIDLVAVAVDESAPNESTPDEIAPPSGLPVEDLALSSSTLAPENAVVTVRILSMQTEAPDATAITDLKVDLGGAAADGMYLYKKDNKRNLILTSTSFNNYYSRWNDSAAFGGTSSMVSKLNVSDPLQSAIEQTITIDGQIISSRRIDNNLFIASRFYPRVVGIDPYSMNADDYKAAVEATDLSTVMPKIRYGADDATTDLINPADCFVSENTASNDYYHTPDIVTLAVIDLDTLTLKDSECFLGATETLYATPNSVFLATTRWDYSSNQPFNEEDDQVDMGFFDPRVDTDIHQFAINGSSLSYSGSGVVAGHLGWNSNRKPFRMSERDGYLRVATISDRFDESVSPINVSVLKLAGDGELTTVAQLPNANNPAHIGKPGERLYASRYLGDRGYLVTFRQTDPLYVIDFSNPEDPKLAGELEIEGYSDYLQPIGQDYLLGIGKDSIAQENGSGGLDQGVKLSLFNVSDAKNPTEVQSLIIGERGTHASALRNHRAITIQPATDSHPTRVAFGIDVTGDSNAQQLDAPWRSNPWVYSGLHGFEIKTGTDAGIENIGVMKVSTQVENEQYGVPYSEDRSVIVDNSVYYINGSKVFAADWSDLGNFSGPR